METKNPSFIKQYAAVKGYCQDGVVRIDSNGCKAGSAPTPFPIHESNNYSTQKFQMHNCAAHGQEIVNEEPIDLTTFKEPDQHAEFKNENSNNVPSREGTADQSGVCYPKRRRKRRKFAYTADGKLVLVSNDENLQSPSSFSESKQLEILKAAKSLFSKRTRTLYHWMYPNAAKPQIKAAVSSSWESLGVQEKDFYISQVLGRFGFPQSSLMVNPQLGGIKELPLISETTEIKSKSRELQSAISSIMPENPMPPELGGNSLTFEEFEEINELTKKRRGRPPGSSNKKHKYTLAGGTVSQDFKDDPELSQELEQFATMFNLSKI